METSPLSPISRRYVDSPSSASTGWAIALVRLETFELQVRRVRIFHNRQRRPTRRAFVRVPPCALGRETPLSIARYEIIVRGRLSSTLVTALGDFDVFEIANGRSHLVGPVPDQSRLHGLFQLIRELNIELISVNPIAPEHDRAQVPGRANVGRACSVRSSLHFWIPRLKTGHWQTAVRRGPRHAPPNSPLNPWSDQLVRDAGALKDGVIPIGGRPRRSIVTVTGQPEAVFSDST
jgi:hypothetical protein